MAGVITWRYSYPKRKVYCRSWSFGPHPRECDRQHGRLRVASVIDCDPNLNSIGDAISRLFSPEFEAILPDVENPYGNGGASESVVSLLEQRPLHNLLKKRFYDLSASDEFKSE